MGKRTIKRTEIIPVKGTTKLHIGDPWYYEDGECGNDLTFDGNISASPLGAIKIEEVSEETEFMGKMLTIDSIEVMVVQASSQDKIDCYLNDRYYPDAVKKEIELGCDTARFEIETKYGFDEFMTGADGYYGNLLVNKQYYGMILNLSFDADLFDFDEVRERFLNLFPEDKKRKVAS